MNREPIRTIWKQMMPISDKYTVLLASQDEAGNPEWFQPESEGWAAPCLVLYENTYEDGEIESGVAVFAMDVFGTGDLE